MLDAFTDLARDRENGMGIGPIPYTKMWWYFEQQGMDSGSIRDFCRLLSCMDDAWLTVRQAEEERKAKNRPPAGSRGRVPRK